MQLQCNVIFPRNIVKKVSFVSPNYAMLWNTGLSLGLGVFGQLVRLKMGAFQVTPTSCTLGRILEVTESCHKLSFSPKVGMMSYDDLSEDEVKLIQYRSGCYHYVSGSTIFLHLKIYFVEKFEVEQRFCCDPFGQHASKVKSCLKVLELEDVARFPFIKVIPGRKCCNCRYNQLKNHDKEQKEAISHPDYGSKKVDVDGISLEFLLSKHIPMGMWKQARGKGSLNKWKRSHLLPSMIWWKRRYK